MRTTFAGRPWATIRLGIGLGCLAGFAGSLVFSAVAVADVHYSIYMERLQQALLHWQFWAYVVIGALMAFSCAVVPASLGGAVIGLVLRRHGGGTRSLKMLGVSLGVLAGGFALIPAVRLAHILYGDLLILRYARVVHLSGIAVALAAGAWVGGRLADYEESSRAGPRDQSSTTTGGQRGAESSDGSNG